MLDVAKPYELICMSPTLQYAMDHDQALAETVNEVQSVLKKHVTSESFRERYRTPDKIRLHTKIQKSDRRYQKEQRFVSDAYWNDVVCVVLLVCWAADSTAPDQNESRWYVVDVKVT